MTPTVKALRYFAYGEGPDPGYAVQQERDVVEIKLFEVRDKGTFIPVMAVRLASFDDAERFLLRRAGYGDKEITLLPDALRGIGLEPYVILCKLDGVEAHYDSFEWPNQRTMGETHRHMIAKWDGLRTGAVIDVEYILGESGAPKRSESHD